MRARRAGHPTLATHNWASAFAAVTDNERRGRGTDGAALPPAATAAFEVVAVYDAGEATRDEFCRVWAGHWGQIAAYADFYEMLRNEAVDILVVGTRQTYHAENIVGALQAGVHTGCSAISASPS